MLVVNSVVPNAQGGVVSFTMAGMTIPAMNRTFVVQLPIDTQYNLFSAIREHLIAHAQGLRANQVTPAGAAVTALIATPTDIDTTPITPGT
jgi:hypothetical protein